MMRWVKAARRVGGVLRDERAEVRARRRRVEVVETLILGMCGWEAVVLGGSSEWGSARRRVLWEYSRSGWRARWGVRRE